MRLSLEPIPGIFFFCAGAFRFMSDSLILATQMIDDGAISVINDLVKVRGRLWGVAQVPIDRSRSRSPNRAHSHHPHALIPHPVPPAREFRR